MFWTNAGTGNWTDGANWSTGAAPGPHPDMPAINNGGTAVITGTVDPWRINLGEGLGESGHLVMDGPAATIGLGASDGPFMTIGSMGVGTVRVINGAILNANSNPMIGGGSIDNGNTGSGTVTVDGPGSAFFGFAAVTVGYLGTGTLNVTNGGLVAYDVISADHDTLGFLDGIQIAQMAGSAGTVNIGGAAGDAAVNAGFLNMKVVQGGLGAATLQFNHTATEATPYFFTRNNGAHDVVGSAGTAAGVAIVISGSTRVINTTGFTVLGAANSYTGGTLVNGGTLQAGVAGAFTADTAYAVNGGVLDLNNFDLAASALSGAGGTVALGSATLTVNQAGNTTYAGQITGTGALVKTGAGTLRLNGNQLYSGGTTVNGGTLQAGLAGAFSDGTAYTVTGGTLDLNNFDLSVSSLDGSGGSIALGSAALTVDQAGDTTYAGAITGSGSLVKAGSGDLVLSGANTYSGGTTVTAGVLRAGAAGALSANTAYVVNGGVFDLNNFNLSASSFSGTGGQVALGSATLTVNQAGNTTYAGQITGTGTLVKTGAGTFRLNTNQLYTGGTTVNGGTLQAGVAGAFATDTAYAVNSGVLDLNNFNLSASSLSGSGGVVSLGSAALTVDQAGDTIYAGVITGSGSLVKAGAGELVLSGNNGYTGATTVEAGVLRINGNQSAATGLVTVENTGALGGSGTLGGSVIIESGGRLAAGNSPGTLNILGDLTQNAGSLLDFELGQAGVAGGPLNDLINVSGNLTLDGTLNVIESAGGTFGPGLYRLINYGGTLTNNTLDVGAVPAGFVADDLYVQTSVAQQVNLVNTAGLDLVFWDGAADGRNNGTISGGDGIWLARPANDNWATADGAINGPWRAGGFAIFQGAAGTVTVDNTAGAVIFGGAQFAADGYVIDGDVLTAAGPATVIRVGDGTSGGAGYTARIDAEITGATSLEKTDLGTLILGGANTYTGPTTVTAGTLQLDDAVVSAAEVMGGARLAGSGTVNGNLINQGLLSPGASPGLININGDFTQTSAGTFLAELAGTAPADYDRLIITGQANLDGTLQIVPISGFEPAVDQTFEIISATSLNGTFADVISPWDFISATVVFEVLYEPDGVVLSFTQLPFAGFGRTPNQIATGQAIDDAIAAGTIPNLRTALNTSATDDAVRANLNRLSPQRYERLFDQAVQLSDALVRSTENHLGSVSLEPGMNFWTQVAHSKGRHGGDADIDGAETRATGLMVGVDVPLSTEFTAGVLFRYTDERLQLDDEGSRTEIERYTPAIYARYAIPRAWFVEAVAGVGFAENDHRREINIPGFVRTAEGDNTSQERFVSVRTGYAFTRGKLHLTPYVGLQHVRWESETFTETGADEASLRVHGQKGESLASRVGVSLGYDFGGESYPRFMPVVDLAWRHEFQQSRRDIEADLGGLPYTVQSQRPNVDGFSVGAGFDAALTPRISLFARVGADWDVAADRVLEVNGGFGYRF